MKEPAENVRKMNETAPMLKVNAQIHHHDRSRAMWCEKKDKPNDKTNNNHNTMNQSIAKPLKKTKNVIESARRVRRDKFGHRPARRLPWRACNRHVRLKISWGAGAPRGHLPNIEGQVRTIKSPNMASIGDVRQVILDIPTTSQCRYKLVLKNQPH